jgi:hypothetical protein
MSSRVSAVKPERSMGHVKPVLDEVSLVWKPMHSDTIGE